MAYYTVRQYNPSGIGVQFEMVNVYAKDEEEAKEVLKMKYRVSQCFWYCICAFKQEGRI